MHEFRPICAVVAVAMLASGSYMMYDAASNPLPSATVGLICGGVFWALGAFAAFFCWRRTNLERVMSAAGHGGGGARSSGRFRGVGRRWRWN